MFIGLRVLKQLKVTSVSVRSSLRLNTLSTISDMALKPLGRIAKLAKLDVNVSECGNTADVVIPTLALDDIDRTGNINVWRLQKMMTMARMAAYHIPNPDTGETFLEYDKFTEGYYTFLASMKTEVSREFYELARLEDWPGVRIKFNLGHMGTASLNTVATLQNATTGQELAWNTNTVVCVDKKTRKPAVIPDWWKDKYSGVIVGNKKLHIQEFSMPEDAYHYQTKVIWSDVDGYKHANYLAYIRYCLDAAMDAIVNEHFTHFGGDIFGHHVKKLEVLYKGESLGGDLLNVYTWQDQTEENTLFFNMKRGEKTLFQCKMEFFPVGT